jgi:hypothetical protein
MGCIIVAFSRRHLWRNIALWGDKGRLGHKKIDVAR